MSVEEHPLNPESNSASRLAYISLAILVAGVLVLPAAIPLSILALVLSRKAKSLESIDDVARSVAKITYVLSIVLLVAVIVFGLVVVGLMTFSTGVVHRQALFIQDHFHQVRYPFYLGLDFLQDGAHRHFQAVCL